MPTPRDRYTLEDLFGDQVLDLPRTAAPLSCLECGSLVDRQADTVHLVFHNTLVSVLNDLLRTAVEGEEAKLERSSVSVSDD